MRTEIDYKKEGFSQIFPVLYITNDKEKALVFGFGTKNISFVWGENDSYKKRKDIDENEKNNADVLNYGGIGLNKMDYKEKLIMAVAVLGCVSVLYYLIKKRK